MRPQSHNVQVKLKVSVIRVASTLKPVLQLLSRSESRHKRGVLTVSKERAGCSVALRGSIGRPDTSKRRKLCCLFILATSF